MEPQLKTPKAWFDFLLNPTLLEQHLQKENSDPSQSELIIDFIFNAIKKNENSVTENENMGEATLSVTKRMKHILTVLPLQVAAFSNWNLSCLQEKLPFHIQDFLLNSLLNEVLEEPNPACHSSLDTGPLAPHQLFVLSLYHRYALSTIVKSKLPSKPVKVPNVGIPGQQDPRQESREVQESIVGNLERNSDTSMAILERLLTAGQVKAPTLESFVTNVNSSDLHMWDKCKLVPDEQFKYQIHYDIGNYHFLMEKFSEGLHHFEEAVKLLPELGPNPEFCNKNEAKLHGFHKSCLAICGRCTPVDKRITYDRFIHSLNNDYEGLIGILTEDNMSDEIPFYLRQNLQLDLMAKQDIPNSLLFHVQTLNVVGCVLRGKPWDNLYPITLQETGSEGVQYLIQLLSSKFSLYSEIQRAKIKSFIETLALCHMDKENIMPYVMSSATLSALFTHEEIVAMRSWHDSKIDKQSPIHFATGVTKPDITDHMWNLTESYDISLLEKSFSGYLIASPIKADAPKKAVIDLNSKWDAMIPIPIKNTICKLTEDPKKDLVFLFICKSFECTNAKSFSLATEFLSEAHSLICKLISSKDQQRPIKMIKWLILVTKIQHQMHQMPCVQESEIRALVSECKQCLSSLNSREMLVPWSNIVHWCVLLLLNSQDWPSVCGNGAPPSSHFTIMALIKPLASACQSLQHKSPTNKTFLDIFNTIVNIMSSSPSSNQAIMGRTKFLDLVFYIKDPICLSLIISLLGFLFNFKLEDPPNSLHVDYQNLWPLSCANIDYIDKHVLRDILNSVVNHATKFYTSGTYTSPNLCYSWFVIKADLAYNEKAHRKALQNYLTAIFVATNYLRNDTNNPEQRVMDDRITRRMISSCMALHCYTQAAILCQFLDPVDYTTAIGCLQERGAVDGMDAYYNCLFDVTLMEFIINIHQKKGESQRRDKVIKIIGNLELNSNNNEEIQREAAKVRKHRFLRAMAKLYL